MKLWIKILISLSIVIVVGFSVWVFFFREKEEVQAYNGLSELLDYKESLGLEEKLLDLSLMNYYNKDAENVIDDSTSAGQEIYRLRAICLGSEKIIGVSNGISYTYDSYRITDMFVNDILEYYLPYTRTTRVNKKSLNNLKDCMDNYIEDLKDMNSTLIELIAFQEYITGESNDVLGLKGRYNILYYKLREYLNSSSNLISSVMRFVDVSICSDNILVDVRSSLYDAFARALNVSTSVEPILENDYAHDLHIIMTRIREYDNGDSIFSEKYGEYKYLNSYSTLYNRYADSLNYIFSSKNLEKRQMASGINLSQIQEDAQQFVINVLNVLGFRGE